MRHLIGLAFYLGAGALFYAMFIGAQIDWSSAWTYGWLLAWPIALVVKFVSAVLTFLGVALLVILWLFLLSLI